MKTNLPKSFAFDLKLARDCGWPLVTKDGRKAEVLKWDARGEQPLFGYIAYEDWDDESAWCLDGQWATNEMSGHDLQLSANLSDPAVQRAVEAAHREMEPISHSIDGKHWHKSNPPVWNWANRFIYLPTRLLPPEPFVLPEPPAGYELFKPKAGDEVPSNSVFYRPETNTWESIFGSVFGTGMPATKIMARPLPTKPTPVLWSKPEHVPGPVCWLRETDNPKNQRMVVHLDSSGLVVGGGAMYCNAVLFGEHIKNYEHSTDRVNWSPCTITEASK